MLLFSPRLSKLSGVQDKDREKDENQDQMDLGWDEEASPEAGQRVPAGDEPAAGDAPDEPVAGDAPEKPAAGDEPEKPVAGDAPEKPAAGDDDEPAAGDDDKPAAGDEPDEPVAGDAPEKPGDDDEPAGELADRALEDPAGEAGADADGSYDVFGDDLTDYTPDEGGDMPEGGDDEYAMEGAIAEAAEEVVDETIDAAAEDVGAEMTFLEHIEDLRWTILRVVGALILGCVFVGFFLTKVMALLEWPLVTALGGRSSEVLATRSFAAVFSTMFQVLFLGGFALSLPVILYFVAQFVAPGLTVKEKKLLGPGCVAGAVLFFTGASFSYFVLVPAAIRMSVMLNEAFGFQMLWSPETYFGMLVWMVIGVGLSFEFPLILLLLVYIGILTHEKLVAFRPYSIVVFLVLAAIITPTTDPFTFLLMAAPMTLLYEISIRLAKLVEGKRDAGLAGA